MLVVLSAAPTNLTGLARSLDVAPSTALRMVDRLIGSGFVDRRVSPQDRRQTELSLSPTGARLVRQVTARRRRDLAGVVSQLSADELGQLTDSMSRFASVAENLWDISHRPPE